MLLGIPRNERYRFPGFFFGGESMLKRVISVIALFDDEGYKKIRDIQNMMQQSPSWLNDLPHLTLAVYDL